MQFDINQMLSADVYPHPVKKIQLVETHASWVVLTGDFAYKIKKPVNFGFLDFSTLEKRKNYCEQEIMLNRRLTKNIYLKVVGLSSQDGKITITGQNIIEYAVQMQQFDQSAQLDRMLENSELTAEHMHALAKLVAEFHQKTDKAPTESDFGEPDTIHNPVIENFEQIKQHLHSHAYDQTLTRLQAESEAEFKRLTDLMRQRKQQGYTRNCHGDLHCRNIIWLGDKTRVEADKGPMAFDCIEFNDHFRWIDVMNEIAFLIMDLQHKKQYQLAHRFLNSYLEQTGDYGGLKLLSYYLAYRSMVRAKVAVLQLNQTTDKSAQKLLTLEFESYLQLAETCHSHNKARLIIMRGVSASGKSTISQQMADVKSAIRIRSDVERKRNFSNTDYDDVKNRINSGIYDEKVSELTYLKLQQLAAEILTAGYSVIVDAAFLKVEQRHLFQQLAADLHCDFSIVELTAADEILRDRIKNRTHDISDADLQILDYQLYHWQPLTDEEKPFAIEVNTENTAEIENLLATI